MDFGPEDLASAMSLLSFCRFDPNDHQLIINFLNRKAMGLPLPQNKIQTDAIDKWTNPQELADKVPLGRDLERYFFARTGILVADDRRNDVVGGRGYWKPMSEITEEIVFKDEKIGEKRELIYFEADGSKTQWIMYEYTAFLTIESPSSSPEAEIWVLYKLRNKGDVDEYDNVVSGTTGEAAAAAALCVLNELADDEEEYEPPPASTDTSEDGPDSKRRKGNTSGVVVADTLIVIMRI
ncbi:NAC domain-containing protein 83-like [Carica papaya]|uniref:NAC domain-containing protein 83-like n=1 Tax=Carica papaya TaxID=3649 RepID=UPI000B8CFB23|nr:NAC domain-containing protein 83-like [Carica papaya]